MTSERDEIRVGDLTVPHHTDQMSDLVADRVGPERVPALIPDRVEDGHRIDRG